MLELRQQLGKERSARMLLEEQVSGREVQSFITRHPPPRHLATPSPFQID